MPAYKAPLREIDFITNELFDFTVILTFAFYTIDFFSGMFVVCTCGLYVVCGLSVVFVVVCIFLCCHKRFIICWQNLHIVFGCRNRI